MKVSELARTAGVNPQTVRYYEREGLLDKPLRNAAGYRDYGASAVERLRFILEAKEIGFTLSEIRQLMGLAPGAPQSCGCVQEIVTNRLSELEQRLKTMRRMKKTLQNLLEHCQKTNARSACPVLEILES